VSVMAHGEAFASRFRRSLPSWGRDGNYEEDVEAAHRGPGYQNGGGR
jgi:hypothetical protein